MSVAVGRASWPAFFDMTLVAARKAGQEAHRR
jgi:hypothetical protein